MSSDRYTRAIDRAVRFLLPPTKPVGVHANLLNLKGIGMEKFEAPIQESLLQELIELWETIPELHTNEEWRRELPLWGSEKWRTPPVLCLIAYN